MVPELFQPRSGGEYQSESHVKSLERAIKNAKEAKGTVGLAPVLVFWIGDAWACLDGHHRLTAIGATGAGPKATIGVEVYQGTLDGAMLEATLRNSQNKLAMGDTDKSERAWKLFLLGTGTHKDIATACGVAPKTVQRMAGVVRKLGASPEGMTMLRNLTWWQAREASKGEPIEQLDLDARRAERVKRQAEALGKVIKDNRPDIVGDALLMLNPELATALAQHLVKQLRAENPFPLDDDGLPQFPAEVGTEF
jgi:hypothetical protein